MATRTLIKTLSETDMIILSGGTSKGIGDIFPTILPDLGKIEFLIHGIRIKPGKPTLFASIKFNGERKLITLLPGYPTSALMIFNVFLKDILTNWSRLTTVPKKTIKAKLIERVYSELGRHEFKTVKIKKKNNIDFAIPTKTGSDAISTLVGMDGYFEIPEQVQFIEEDEEIKVILFE